MKLGNITIDRSRWTRQALFIGVNIALLSIVYLAIVAPIRHVLAEGADGVAERQATLAHYEVVVAQEDAVKDYVEQVKDSNARGELLEGASEGIVNANLQARLKTSAERAGVTVRSIQTLPVKTLRKATLNGARLEVFGKLEFVHALARAVESDAPLLLVTSAVLRQQQIFWEADKPNEQIEAQFDVYGGAAGKERP